MKKKQTPARNSPEAAAGPKNSQEITVGKQSSQSMKEIGGTGFELWDTSLLHRTYLAAARLSFKGDDDKAIENRNAGIAGLGLRAFSPTDAVEAMIASQAVALHMMALECARRAITRDLNPDIASKLRKDACNASRAMIDMTEALQRRRGKGAQVVRVERVVVNDGGQAVVGHIQSGAPLPAPGLMSPQSGGLLENLSAFEQAGGTADPNQADNPLQKEAEVNGANQKQSNGHSR